MQRRRWFLIMAALVAAAGLYTVGRDRARPPAGPAFQDLDTVLAGYYKNGWSVLVPPKREGPYRIVPEDHPILPRNSTKGGAHRRIQSASGVEEIDLKGPVDYDQALIELDTADGYRTLVLLKRGG